MVFQLDGTPGYGRKTSMIQKAQFCSRMRNDLSYIAVIQILSANAISIYLCGMIKCARRISHPCHSLLTRSIIEVQTSFKNVCLNGVKTRMRQTNLAHSNVNMHV